MLITESISKSAKPAPKIASIFAAPSKKSSTSASKTESSTNVDKKTLDKGKSKAEDVEDNEGTSIAKDTKEKATSAANSDQGGEISGVDENGKEEAEDSAMESEEEQEQAAKLYVQYLPTYIRRKPVPDSLLTSLCINRAEIFTKKVAGSSKGKYGKGIDWKTGDP